MTDKVMLVAGQSGAKSTFAGGLYEYVDTREGLTINSKVSGNVEDYEDRVRDMMFVQGVYPGQTDLGYTVEYTITGQSFSRPGTNVTLVDLPGEQQEGDESDDKGGLLRPPNELPLLERVRNGSVDIEARKQDYDQNLQTKFELGNPLPSQEDQESVFLHHFDEATKVIFVLNLYKVTELDDKELAYNINDIEYAMKNFRDVAIVPTAVDLYGYDPDSFERSLGRRAFDFLLTPGIRDAELMETLDSVINPGTDNRANEVLNFAKGNKSISFFSAAVPDRDTPGNVSGHLAASNDPNGDFAVRGYDEVIRWLER
mgnify:CR=1 FL=1